MAGPTVRLCTAAEKTELFELLQGHLRDGTMLVIGSGASVAEGLPSMGDIAEFLRAQMPGCLADEDLKQWNAIDSELALGTDIESVLLKLPASDFLAEQLVAKTGECIASAEDATIAQVLLGKRELPMQKLLAHLIKTATEIHAVTTNYDRLIELAAEAQGIGVDTHFAGYCVGLLDPKRSSDAHRESVWQGKQPSLKPVPHLKLHKPHGSLDWYRRNEGVIRCPFTVDLPRAIVPPGATKYQLGYQQHFDMHRNKANAAIKAASRFLVLGYGFNDDHLQQVLCPGLRIDRPTVIATKALSAKGRSVVVESPDCLSLEEGPAAHSTLVTQSGNQFVVPDSGIWSIEGFVKEAI